MTFGGQQDPFGGAPFGGFPGYSGPPVVSAPPQPSPRKTNSFATLSVIFAFVFAPAGAVFGHLALSQIKRTGEPGRDRAQIGTILSYVFTVVAVIALVVWLVVRTSDDTPTARGSAATSTATSTVTTTTTTTMAGPGPVQPSQLAGLLLTVDEIKRLTNAPNPYKSADRTTVDGSEGMVVTPPECLPALFSGLDSVYLGRHGRSTVARELSSTTGRTGIAGLVERVVMFDNGLTATGQVQQIVSGWRGCTDTTVKVVIDNGKPSYYDLQQVTTSGQFPTIYLIRSTYQNSAPGFANYRAVAAKANVVVDMSVYGYDVGSGAHDVTAAILARIPG